MPRINFENLYMRLVKRYCDSASTNCPLKALKNMGKKNTGIVPLEKDILQISQSREHSHHHWFETANHSLLAGNAKESDLVELDKGFKYLKPSDKDEIYYRGTHKMIGENTATNNEYNIIWSAKEGDIIKPYPFYPYTATQDNLSFARKYAYTGDPNKCRAMLVEIRTKAGSQISVNGEHGGEGVFPRNRKYRLLQKRTIEAPNPLAAHFDDEPKTFPLEYAILELLP